ncbi:MAG: alginate export family protein [Armatimonadota bacterium]|nr:alginate export family protein [Armatimonadota bacterium]
MRLQAYGMAAISFLCYIFGVAMAVHAQPKAADSKPLRVNAEWRLRWENRASTDFCSVNHRDPQDELSRLRLNFSAAFSANSTLVARLQHSYKRNRMNGCADTQEKSGFQQLYFDSRWGNLSLRLGRQELGYGDYRLLILSQWDNIGFTWDAVRVGVKSNRWQTDLIYGRPGMFPTSATHPVLYGIYTVYKPSPTWQSDIYLLRKEVIAAGMQQRIWAIGARPVIQLNKGAKLTAEAVFQNGEIGTKDLKAWGYWARLDVPLNRAGSAKLILQRDFASGGNPDDSTLHTFDQFFGMSFGILGRMGLQGWRNMSTWRIGFVGSPAPRWQVTADVHLNRLANARDYWYGGAGSPVRGVGGKPLRDPTGAAGTEVGTELNLTLSYSLTAHMQLSAGYGRFVPGRFVRETNNGFADRTEWFYLQTTRKF